MVGVAFCLKLVGPWTVFGKKNESGPNTTWSVPVWAKQRNGSCGWLAACAVPGSADSVTAEASTAVTADARAAVAREIRRPALSLSLGYGFVIFRSSFPGGRFSWPLGRPPWRAVLRTRWLA